ncbi:MULTISPECIES: energy transducer TonB [unclassified Pseudoalteromonas]|uniref:energy transducer TonB n=1 Tax=unclassified Pseudoalteromonas TaxID=194690 RepID=UPI000C07D4C4|nr:MULTISPECIES: energy transducer TonB [unclassified Pseudoalteromonas]MDP2634884.1 energy transducer TonB [Pseudoalteromonas sp. 1_MG-2023]PHN89129.1 energy transducer TonB [Pseudoalteromonas sp. 3D05]
MKVSTLVLCLGLAYSNYAVANETLNADFKTAYQNYLTAQQGDENAYPFAKQAYTLGKQLYGPTSDNTANLATNFANALKNKSKESKAERYDLFKSAYNILAKNHSENSLILVDSLTGMANSASTASHAVDLYDQVIALAKHNNQFKLAADLQLAAAKDFAYSHFGRKHLTARKYLKQADEYYTQNLPENSVERIKADFLVAAFAQGKKKYNKAIKRLNRIVNVFDNALSFDHQAELSAHSKLVHLYELKGQSEEATKHCIAIAKMVPWNENQEQTPLYRENPDYPLSKVKQGRSGYVQMEFDVTPTGFVENISVLKSVGGIAFEKEALKAIEKWRYAPKFEDGRAVLAKTKVQLDFKIR